jgi:UDPglucose--hexose-1-phosphate uridylyltransferase
VRKTDGTGVPSYLMPEYRQNPLTREWVILSSERQTRPSEFLDQPARRENAACPFCLGNEHETPEELARYSASGSKDAWSVRVVPNKYPAVTADPHRGPLPKGEGVCNADCLFRTAPALGEHEVIIESPRHVVSLTDLTPAERELLFLAYRDRIAFHRAAGKARYVQAFKNVGPLAGASIEHSHSQLMALEQLPQNVERDAAIAESYFRRNKRSLLHSLVQAELAGGTRVVAESPSFVAFCPFASRFPYEVCVAGKASGCPFEELQIGELGELARIARDIIGRIERALGPVAYNYYLRPAPFDMKSPGQYDWHIEIFPRLVKVAGFEWSTGIFINTVSPEAAAEMLRSSL